MPNIENINKTIELIENDNKLSFDMIDYFSGHREGNECGTSCCLAGYATIAAYGKDKTNIPEKYFHHDEEYPEDSYYDFFDIGRDVLGIDGDTAEKLFIPRGGHIHSTNKDYAVAVLKALRDTNEVIWNTLPVEER